MCMRQRKYDMYWQWLMASSEVECPRVFNGVCLSTPVEPIVSYWSPTKIFGGISEEGGGGSIWRHVVWLRHRVSIKWQVWGTRWYLLQRLHEPIFTLVPVTHRRALTRVLANLSAQNTYCHPCRVYVSVYVYKKMNGWKSVNLLWIEKHVPSLLTKPVLWQIELLQKYMAFSLKTTFFFCDTL